MLERTRTHVRLSRVQLQHHRVQLTGSPPHFSPNNDFRVSKKRGNKLTISGVLDDIKMMQQKKANPETSATARRARQDSPSTFYSLLYPSFLDCLSFDHFDSHDLSSHSAATLQVTPKVFQMLMLSERSLYKPEFYGSFTTIKGIQEAHL